MAKAKKWGALLLSMGLIGLFMFGIAPLGHRLPAIQRLAGFIEESGIDASALYYTEVEEASVADSSKRRLLVSVCQPSKTVLSPPGGTGSSTNSRKVQLQVDRSEANSSGASPTLRMTNLCSDD